MTSQPTLLKPASHYSFPSLTRDGFSTLQVNLGYRCNQSCIHCHVNAGPTRWEEMSAENIMMIPAVLKQLGLRCLDLTGGAPELHQGFRELVIQTRQQGVEVIDRCNLTILSEPGQQDLAQFLADQAVTVVASLPCYEAENVDQQRGAGVFERSLQGLRQLNQLGYGDPDSDLVLNLVYNPLGPQLPPNQETLEESYRSKLWNLYGIRFTALLTLANMPIKRFAQQLAFSGQLDSYQKLLENSHNPVNLNSVMCLELISVDWQGKLFDCDFNQQLDLPLQGQIKHLRDLLSHSAKFSGLPIVVDSHCFGCTAGQGSSCGGSLQ
ncbi:MAG: arsenosugar biosynthesis radical SAM (seleno)protein ArsS [Prochlorococcus sp.]